MLDNAVSAGFLRPETREMLVMADSLETLLERFEAWQPSDRPVWLDREAS
jgi:hypothetical protein